MFLVDLVGLKAAGYPVHVLLNHPQFYFDAANAANGRRHHVFHTDPRCSRRDQRSAELLNLSDHVDSATQVHQCQTCRGALQTAASKLFDHLVPAAQSYGHLLRKVVELRELLELQGPHHRSREQLTGCLDAVWNVTYELQNYQGMYILDVDGLAHVAELSEADRDAIVGVDARAREFIYDVRARLASDWWPVEAAHNPQGITPGLPDLYVLFDSYRIRLNAQRAAMAAAPVVAAEDFEWMVGVVPDTRRPGSWWDKARLGVDCFILGDVSDPVSAATWDLFATLLAAPGDLTPQEAFATARTATR